MCGGVSSTQLSFRQMSMVKNAFIPLMSKYHWSAKAINAFAQLFTQLEMHPLCQREFGERALITYQARVHCEWHDQLKLGSAFNVGLINEDLLQSIYKELLDKAQVLSLKEVSIPSLPFLKHSLTSLLLFSHPCPVFALRTPPLSFAPCTMHHPHLLAPCTMHLAPLHFVPCTIG